VPSLKEKNVLGSEDEMKRRRVRRRNSKNRVDVPELAGER
jgi:hypothetical protein